MKVRVGSFLENPCFFENKKEPQRPHESFGGSIASRSLICVRNVLVTSTLVLNNTAYILAPKRARSLKVGADVHD